MQQSLFAKGPPVAVPMLVPATRNYRLERLAVRALELYVDDYSFPCPRSTNFGVGAVAWFIGCEPSGPFCIGYVPSRCPDINELYAALDALAADSQVIREKLYHGTTGPGDGDYQGFSYTYRISEQA